MKLLNSNSIVGFVVGSAVCLTACLSIGSSDSEKVKDQRPVVSSVTMSPDIPSSVSFCGKDIDLTRYNMHEGFDRELSSFTYFHSTTMLLIKRANRYFPIIEPILKANGIPDDFKYLVEKLHEAGIGVIMDWVPAHFPKDAFALGRFDGTPLYEDPDPTRGEHPDWGTYVFNFGRREVRNFLVANACFWLDEYHIDALRVDAVSSMLYLDYSRKPGQWHPNIYGGRENLEAIDFLKEATATAYKNNPGIMMIAEESTAYPGITAPTDAGGLGFGLKWNMGWMHDTLQYLHEEPINRKWHHNEITFSMVYAYSEHYVLPISHDEVVYGKGSLFGKMPGDDWQRYAGVRALFAYQWAHPGKKLSFMGNEVAQYGEWDHDGSVDWDALNWPDHRGVQKLVADLNTLYKASPALWSQDFDPAGFQWLTSDDADHNTLSFVRIGKDGEQMVVVVNFSGEAWEDYQVPLTKGGKWTEVLTTDDKKYGGSDIHNGTFKAVKGEYHSRDWSAKITVPALGAVFLKPEL